MFRNCVRVKTSIFFIFFMSVLLFSPAADSLPPGQVSFTWAFLYQSKDGPLQSIDYSLPVVELATGDKVKFMFRLKEPGYIYFLLLDSAGSLELIFPEDVPSFSAETIPGRGMYVPPGQEWYFLEEPGGVEQFFLVASPVRLHDLEKAIAHYLTLASEYGLSKPAQEAAGEVMAWIKQHRQRYSSFRGTVEKPVPVAGNFRSLQQLGDGLAIDITGVGFYARTIRIRH